jgi:hypothetical protein
MQVVRHPVATGAQVLPQVRSQMGAAPRVSFGAPFGPLRLAMLVAVLPILPILPGLRILPIPTVSSPAAFHRSPSLAST